jgi:hypothetical protein
VERVNDKSNDVPKGLEPESIEGVAGRWLAAEQTLARGSGNPAQTESLARDLSGRYDAMIRAATREELRLAWEAARLHQAEQEIGSEGWADARRLSELLHDEYLASDAGENADAAGSEPSTDLAETKLAEPQVSGA